MPVVGQRDPEATANALTSWLANQTGRSVEVRDLIVPQSSGFSNETFLFSAHWDGSELGEALVLRSQPQQYALFPEINLIEQQYLSMKLLREHSDVPVATVRWAEASTAILGQPFFVMNRLDGFVPGDNPPYMTEGPVFDMDPTTRNQWHKNGIETLTRVGKVDWRAAGFAHLDKQHHGALGVQQRQGYFQHFLEWATQGQHHPVVHPVWDHLIAEWPDDSQHIDLCWGDARPGNQMYNGTEVIGVFDWEMVSLGNCESDLGWWLFLQRYSSDGVGAPLLEGMLSRGETIAEWERHLGRAATNIDFYERLAGFHFSLVMIKLAEMMEFPEMSVNNPVADITLQLCGIPPVV